MALKSGSNLTTGEFLSNDDYIQSPNSLFFAIMQSDGNFCVYRGTGPDDNHGFVWGCNRESLPGGPYFAIMQSDGNFCVYKGTGPSDPRGGVWCSMQTAPEGLFYALMQDDGNFCVYRSAPNDYHGVWCTMAIDPVVDIEISTINYDVEAAKILSSSPAELYRQQVSNHTMQTQTSTISGSESVSETSGWSDSLGVKIGVKTTFSTGIPFVAEGKVEVSTEVSNTYTWSGSTTRTKTWSFNTPVSVPSMTTMIAIVAATTSTITVPYTLSGTVILKSGTRMPGQIKGMYTGTNSHDLTVTFVQLTPQNQEVTSSSKPLEATATLITAS